MISFTVVSRALRTPIWRRSVVEAARMQPMHLRLSPAIISNATFACHNVNRTFSSPPEKDTIIDSPRKPGNGPGQKKQVDSFGASNFRKLLQYQDLPPRKFQPVKRSQRRGSKRREKISSQQEDGKVTSFKQYGEQLVSSQQDGGAFEKNETTAKRPPRENSNDRDRHANRRKNQGQPSHGRRHWRQRKESESNSRVEEKQKVNMATSDWIKINNIPPNSKLSDLFPSLNQILDHEIQKGIIDLDALGDITNISDDDGATLKALEEIGALDSLYSTRQINDDSGSIPLWTPSSSNFSNSHEGECPMVLEARVHLTQNAQPVGWFIRLPNRSVVHAILNHIHRGWTERHQQWDHEIRVNDPKYQRKNWREGLWRGVYEDYELASKAKENKTVVEEGEEECEEVEQVLGDDLVGEREGSEDSTLGHPLKEGVGMTQSHAVEKKKGIDDYLHKYSKLHPYPRQQMESDGIRTYAYNILNCGSRGLSVREFFPDPPSTQYPTWDHHSFHLSPLLNLSDSVVRVQTSRLRTDEQDIKYFFRSYDLEAILPEAQSSTTVPSRFASLPESLGWDVKSKDNVDFLVRGTDKPQKHLDKAAQKGKTHTFLVRFASPADARMAVRDNGEGNHDSRRLSVTQYPQQW